MSLLKKHESTLTALAAPCAREHAGPRMTSPDLPKMAPLHFGPFELRPQTRQLLRRGAQVAIGGRAFDLLCALALRRQRVVSSDELLQIVWPGQPVEPNNLQVQIWALRKLLGPRVITTVARRGYRFVPALAGTPEAHADASTLGEDLRLQALLDRMQDHRLVTLVGDDEAALLQLALACAHRLADAVGGMVWQLDGKAVAASGPTAGLQQLPQAMADRHDRADVLVLLHPAGPAQALAAALQALLAQAPLMRLLVASRQALGLAQEQVLSIVTPMVRTEASAHGSPLRWQVRGRQR